MSRQYFHKEKHYWWKILLDGLLLFFAFLLMYFLRRGHIRIEDNFRRFLPFLFITWFFVTLLSKKFKQFKYENLYVKLRPYFFSAVALAAVLSLELYVLGWYFLNRFIVYFTLGLFIFFEMFYVLLLYFFRNGGDRKSTVPFSAVFFVIEVFFVSMTISFIHFYRKTGLEIGEEYEVLLLGIYSVWIIISLLIHKYEVRTDKGLFKTLIPFWKSEIIIITLVSFFIFATNLAIFSSFIVLGSLFGFSVVENIIVFLYFHRKKEKQGEDGIDIFHVDTINYEVEPAAEKVVLKQEKYRIPLTELKSDLFQQKLKNVYLHGSEELFQFVDKNIALSSLDILETFVLYTSDITHIKKLSENSLTFFMNLDLTNDFSHINKTFIQINKILKTGGIFVGNFESLEQSKSRFYRRVTYLWGNILYPLYFISKRVIPKTPLFRKIYFFISKGRKRCISRAEILGRLNFCGFKLIDLKAIDEKTWFIVKKAKSPLSDRFPSYGLIFKQKRVGKDNRMIFTFKFRTMHPYSEYIQDYIYNLHSLDEIGKIHKDFRITAWGKILRKFWIDEIPMTFNLLKGELKVFGVRPLSQSFFKTYPEDLKKTRTKYKPGLIPPYYVDMPDTIEEVWESERNYLEKYSRHPFRTDFRYFFKALKNIFFYHAKSG